MLYPNACNGKDTAYGSFVEIYVHDGISEVNCRLPAKPLNAMREFYEIAFDLGSAGD